MVKRVRPYPGMVVQNSVEFEPGIYTFPSADGIRIAASGILINGNGAVLLGPGQPELIDSFQGTGIVAQGQDSVTIWGLSIHGFHLGMYVEDGDKWNIEKNDFSGNYSDVDYGWGEGFPYGALLLCRVAHSRIVSNTAVSNWNGLSLRESHDNEIRDNRFSHCTNVCLKLWNSSTNHIERNNFSHGVRIRPGETHARDSTCALIESGSNENRIIDNDFTYGGDGVFIRPLNGWHSQDNYFEGNDGSFAHNNAWECWSPNNTFVHNKGNYSSYGFWMGGSDGTIMVGNEAAYNGTLHHNAPEKDFGHAGIAVVHGSSSHMQLIGNKLHHNQGPGLAVGFKDDYPAVHWMVVANSMRFNRNGIYVRHARNLYLGENDLSDNRGETIVEGPNVVNLRRISATQASSHSGLSPNVIIQVTDDIREIGERSYVCSTRQTLDAKIQLMDGWTKESVQVEWHVTSSRFEGETSPSSGEQSSSRFDWRYLRRFESPGYYRLSVTVFDGTFVGIEWVNVYVVDEDCAELGTEGSLEGWDIIPYTDPVDFKEGVAAEPINLDTTQVSLAIDKDVVISGNDSLKLTTTLQNFRMRVSVDLPDGEGCSDTGILRFWIRVRHHTVFGLRGSRHRVRIGKDEEHYLQFERDGHLFSNLTYNEAWCDWNFVQIPLAGNDCWHVQVVGNGCREGVRYIEIVNEGSDEERGTMEMWLDGLQMVP